MPQTEAILLSMSLSHSFLRQSSRHWGRRLLAVGIPESIFGFGQSHFHFHCVGDSIGDHRLHKAVNIVFLASSGHSLIMLNVRLVGDGAVFVDAMATTALNSSFVVVFSNISSKSLQSRGLLGTCEIPYQMLSTSSPGLLSDILIATDLNYSLSVRNLSCSIAFSSWGREWLCCCGKMKCSANASVRLS